MKIPPQPAMNKSETRQPLYHEIYQILKRRILEGDLRPGTVLYVKAVAEACDVSRAPAEQALILLKNEELLANAPRRGYVVNGLPCSGNAADEDLRRAGSGDLAAIASDLGKTRPLPAWQRIYSEVEREVASHAVFGRHRVNENELARHYGVSRTVSHDVLVRLNNLGILEKDHQSRWAVLPLSRERIAHLYEVRRLLEPAAIAGAAPYLARADLLAARGRIDRALARYPALSVDELDDLEQDLHGHCLSACPNADLLALLRATQLLLVSNKHMLRAVTRLPNREPFLEEHRLVLDCLIEGRGDAAAEALLRHLQIAEANVQDRADTLRSSPPPPLPPYMRAEAATR